MISLLLGWWGLSPRLLDPPADAPDEVIFMAEGYEGYVMPKIDAFRFYEVRDVVWLLTGVAGFIYGLTTLLGARVARALRIGVAIGAVASIAFLLAAIASPPDFIAIMEERAGVPPDRRLGFDLPAGRELGPWIALVSAIGVAVSTVLPKLLMAPSQPGAGSARS